MSPTCLTNVVEDIMGQPLAQKKLPINNQKVKTAKRMAEVQQQLTEEDGNAGTATATTMDIRMVTGT